ncbi:phospholipase D family protein [Salinimicrobium sp. 3283s]|uniref:phospholipase D family protein n=1 Tax=Salinimicrobium sp. 3283s TaxID=3114359 RepID=UPI0031EA5031
MSQFLTGKDLEDCVYNIIWEAEKTLLIVSPYVKLDNYFKELFDRHEANPKLHIVLVFGKNEMNVKRSMRAEDFEFFKKFPNVSIVYVPNLHAKYYGNEKKGIITSINLYDYSFKNNIEFGVYSEQSLINRLSSSTSDLDAWNKCTEIAFNNEVVFAKRPIYKNKKLLINLGKDYVKSEVLLDATDKFYGSGENMAKSEKKLGDFPDSLDYDEKFSTRPERDWTETATKQEPSKPVETVTNTTKNQQHVGYCIRTGEEIEFNPEKPMSNKAFKMWSKYGDKDYQEKFCHYSGEPSNGETTFAKPILRKNWKKAMKN